MTATNQWGRPELPARPKRDPSDLATHFGAFLSKGWLGATRTGDLTVKFTIPASDKWLAFMLDSAEGYMIDVEVWLRKDEDDAATVARVLGREDDDG